MPEQNQYRPAPIDTSHVALPVDLLHLHEKLAENAHEVWAAKRIADRWTYGPHRDDARKTTPVLCPTNSFRTPRKNTIA